MAERGSPRDRETDVRERFLVETAEHELTVIHEDGVYRHLRIQKPRTWSYGYDLVTWPGFLAVTGDTGDFLFARTRDMFEWFRSDRGGINPSYWAQKLQAPRGTDGVRQYAPDLLRKSVAEWLDYACEDLEAAEAEALRAALSEQVLDHEFEDLSVVYSSLTGFQHDGFTIDEPWEWEPYEFRHDFLWCCWAIVAGIEKYDALSATATATTEPEATPSSSGRGAGSGGEQQ